MLYRNPVSILTRNMGIVGPALVFAVAVAIYNGDVPGLEPVNATIYIVAAFLFIPSYIQAPRTYALAELRRYGASDLYVFSREFSYNRTGSNFTWAGVNDKSYRIDFSSSEQGAKNGEEVLKTMKSTTRIIWFQPGVWVAVFSAILFLNIFLHNGISSLIGDMDKDANVFRIILFYLPSILAFALPIVSFVSVIMRDKILYECASKLASEIEEELNTRAATPMKCYRNICPKCGATSTAVLKNCVSCGASLEIKDDGTSWTSIRFTNDDELL